MGKIPILYSICQVSLGDERHVGTTNEIWRLYVFVTDIYVTRIYRES